MTGRFWIRALDSLEPRRLSQTVEAVPMFFWSPDSRSLGYRSGNSLVLRELPDGPPRVIADLPGPAQGAAWNRRGDLVVALPGGLFRMPSAGDTAQLLMRSEPGQELWRAWPSFLPDGERFPFTVLLSGAGEQALETLVGTLDGRELATVARGIVGA